MSKRERDEVTERLDEPTNGFKVQKVGPASDRMSDEPGRAVSQEQSGGFPVKKSHRQRAQSVQRGGRDDAPQSYKTGKPLRPDHFPKAEGDTVNLTVRVVSEYLQPSNKQVKGRQLWGSEYYTHDSDLVAVLMHCGYVSNISGVPVNSVQEMRVVIQYYPSRPVYPSVLKNGIRSRAWGMHADGCCFKVLQCTLISRQHTEMDIQPTPDGSGNVVPTFTPSHYERAISTRATASNLERRQRALQEVTVQYNLCNEPWSKYSMQGIADRGLKPSQLTSARFFTEVLFLETDKERYQVSMTNRPTNGEPPSQEALQEQRFKFARCKRALPLAYMHNLGLPLPREELEVLFFTLKWEDFQFSSSFLEVKRFKADKEAHRTGALLRYHFTACVEPKNQH